jgi:hypothetical protein
LLAVQIDARSTQSDHIERVHVISIQNRLHVQDALARAGVCRRRERDFPSLKIDVQ